MHTNFLRIFHLILMQRYKWGICVVCLRQSYRLCLLKNTVIVNMVNRSSPPEAFLGKNFLKLCSKIRVEHSCPNVMWSAKQLYWNHTLAWVFPVNLLHISRTPFPKNTSGGQLLGKKTVRLVFRFLYKEGRHKKILKLSC